MDWDVLFVFVVGSYNTKGNLAEMAEACIDWQTRHLVGDGLQLGGGVTKHYEGSGDRSRVFWCFQNHSRFCHFHQYTRNTKYRCRNSFWSLVDGPHNDQIYSHVGHLLDGTIDLVGKDK